MKREMKIRKGAGTRNRNDHWKNLKIYINVGIVSNHRKDESERPEKPERARPILAKAEYLYAPWARFCA